MEVAQDLHPPGFAESLPTLIDKTSRLMRGCRLTQQAKPSTGCLLFRMSGIVLKLPDPARAEAVARHLHVTDPAELARHERYALEEATAALGGKAPPCSVSLPVSRLEVGKLLARVGLTRAERSALLPVVVASHFVDGIGLGRYDDDTGDYAYDIKAASAFKVHALETAFDELGVAIQLMNAAGIFHNDLAPQNILLVRRPGGRCGLTIIDFGVAYIDAPTPWAQPAVDFIDQFYASRLCTGTQRLRDLTFHLRHLGVSKDVFDLSLHRKNLCSLLASGARS